MYYNIKISYTDEFGHNTTVETDVIGNDIHALMSAIGQCVKGFGYAEANVREYIPEC